MSTKQCHNCIVQPIVDVFMQFCPACGTELPDIDLDEITDTVVIETLKGHDILTVKDFQGYVNGRTDTLCEILREWGILGIERMLIRQSLRTQINRF